MSDSRRNRAAAAGAVAEAAARPLFSLLQRPARHYSGYLSLPVDSGSCHSASHGDVEQHHVGRLVLGAPHGLSSVVRARRRQRAARPQSAQVPGLRAQPQGLLLRRVRPHWRLCALDFSPNREV